MLCADALKRKLIFLDIINGKITKTYPNLYKGDILLGIGAEASEKASGLLSAEDYAELKKLIKSGTSVTLTPVDGSISIADNKIGVQVSKADGNLVAVKDDGLFVSVESLPIEKVVGLESRLEAIEKSSVGGIHYKGSVATVNDLPTDAVQGDLYEVLEDNSEWCFNGETWFEYGNTVDFNPIAGNGIEVDGIFTSAYGDSKADVCRRERIDLMVDDNPYNYLEDNEFYLDAITVTRVPGTDPLPNHNEVSEWNDFTASFAVAKNF